MAIYFVFFIFSLLIATILFVMSRMGENAGARAAFVAFSGVTLLLTALLVWVNDLVLPIIESTSTAGDVTTFAYVTMSAAVVGSELWFVVNILFWLGAVVILHSLVTVIMDLKQRRVEEKEDF